MGIIQQKVIGEPMTCELCHATVTRYSFAQKYCPACRVFVKKERDAESNLRRHKARKAVEAEREAQEKISPKKRTPTIEEVNAKAREMHMSYGKYVAMYGGGSK